MLILAIRILSSVSNLGCHCTSPPNPHRPSCIAGSTGAVVTLLMCHTEGYTAAPIEEVTAGCVQNPRTATKHQIATRKCVER